MKIICGFLLFLFFADAVLSDADDKSKQLEKRTDVLEVADAKQKLRHLPIDDDYDDHDDGGAEGALEISSDAYRGDKHLKGNQNLGNVEEEHETEMHHDRGQTQDFSQGGSNFNKNHKEIIADNKELENVKQHDAGEKFGAEALKEHKLGKHKENSKGHKLHGFKNTYHKEEYGDHKTFHDEFLDTDHHHNYDDHHEHRQLQGGKFSKGYKNDGKYKNFEEGDEGHSWGKGGYDSNDEAQYERGGHASKHHHGDKKHEGYHEASSHEGKNSHRKQRKGDAPMYYSQGAHDGPSKSHYSEHLTDQHPSTPHTYHGHESYPSLDENYHGGGHDSYGDHEERSHSAKHIPSDERYRSAYTKPTETEQFRKAPLYKDITPETQFKRIPAFKDNTPETQFKKVPGFKDTTPVTQFKEIPVYREALPEIQVPRFHSDKPKFEKQPRFKSAVHEVGRPHSLNERQYSQPIQAKLEQFYHRYPQQDKPQLHSRPKTYVNSHPLKSTSLQSHSPQLPVTYRQSVVSQTPVSGQGALASHPHSKPYNWQQRDSGQFKYQINEPRVQQASRFDAVQPKSVDHHERTQYVSNPSEHHYRYYK